MDTHLKFYKERKRFFHLLYVKKTNDSREFCAFVHALYTIYIYINVTDKLRLLFN